MSVMPEMATKNPGKNPSKRPAKIQHKEKARRLRLSKPVCKRWSEIMEASGYNNCRNTTRGSNSHFAEALLNAAAKKRLVRSQEPVNESSFEDSQLSTINVKEPVFKKWRDYMLSSGFSYSTESEFATALLDSFDFKNKVVRPQVAPRTFSSSATSTSAATSTLNNATNQNQIFINVEIRGTDTIQSSVSQGSCATATGNPVPRVIVTSFDPEADSFEAAFSKAAESRSLANTVSSENSNAEKDKHINSNQPEVRNVETCDFADHRVLSSSESTESSCSTSDSEVVEVKVVRPQKRKKDDGSNALLTDLTGTSQDPLCEENLFGVVVANYQSKLRQVQSSLEKITQEEEKGEAILRLKTVKEEFLKKKLDDLRKDMLEERRQLKELKKKKYLMSLEESSLQYKILHCQTLQGEFEIKKAR